MRSKSIITSHRRLGITWMSRMALKQAIFTYTAPLSEQSLALRLSISLLQCKECGDMPGVWPVTSIVVPGSNVMRTFT